MKEAPESFWLSRSSRRERAEIVVVGAGLLGVSVAYWLAQAGRRVLLVEAETLASRATGRSTGFVITGSAQPLPRLARRIGRAAALRLWDLSRDSVGLLFAEIERGPIACEADRRGSWRAGIDGSSSELEWRETAEELRAEGFAVEWRGAAAVRGASGSPVLGGALHQPGDGALDPVQLARGLLALAGARLESGVRVRRLVAAPDGGVELHWQGGVLEAEQAVLAVNAYVAGLVPSLATQVRPIRLQALARSAAGGALPGAWTVHPQTTYVRRLSDGTVIAAGAGESDPAAAEGALELPTAAVQEQLEATLDWAFPALSGGAVLQRWAGTIAATSDGLPQVGVVPDVPAAIYATGCNGQGFSVGFGLARHLARYLTGEVSRLDPFH